MTVLCKVHVKPKYLLLGWVGHVGNLQLRKPIKMLKMLK